MQTKQQNDKHETIIRRRKSEKYFRGSYWAQSVVKLKETRTDVFSFKTNGINTTEYTLAAKASKYYNTLTVKNNGLVVVVVVVAIVVVVVVAVRVVESPLSWCICM